MYSYPRGPISREMRQNCKALEGRKCNAQLTSHAMHTCVPMSLLTGYRERVPGKKAWHLCVRKQCADEIMHERNVRRNPSSHVHISLHIHNMTSESDAFARRSPGANRENAYKSKYCKTMRAWMAAWQDIKWYKKSIQYAILRSSNNTRPKLPSTTYA